MLPKSEMVTELQEILENLKNTTMELDRNISSLKEVLDAGRFIPDSLGMGIKEHLQEISDKQKAFVAKYEALNMQKPSEQYIVLETELTETLRVLEENNKYISAVKFFLMLHSEKEQTEQILQQRKEKIEVQNLESMGTQELQVLAEPYIKIQRAFLEVDARKRFSYILDMQPDFDSEILEELNFGDLKLCQADCATKAVAERNEATIESEISLEDEEAIEPETTSKMEEVVQAESAVTVEAEKLQNLVTMSEHEEVAEALNEKIVNVQTEAETLPLDVAGLEKILVSEDSSILKVEKSPKATAKFGVKDFKKDMARGLLSTKLVCIAEAFQYGGYSLKGISEKKFSPMDEYEIATEKLYQYGYLVRYTVSGMGQFYTLSPRGERACASKDSMTFINNNPRVQEKVTHRSGQECIENTTNMAITRLLAFNSVQKVRSLFQDYRYSGRDNYMTMNFFLEGYPVEKEKVVWFAGVITENPEDVFAFKECVEKKTDGQSVLVISGNTLEQAKAVADWLAENLESVPGTIGYTAYFEMDILDRETGMAIMLREEQHDTVMDGMEEVDGREEEQPEAQGARNWEEEQPEAEINENCGSGQYEPKIAENLQRENSERVTKEFEEPDELSENEVETQLQESASTKVQTTVPAISEEEKKQHITAYQEMIVSGKTYAALAYLKALSKTHPVFETTYRQLAYAVNDPMENCAYNSDSLINVFYGSSASVSDYYVVSAALRNYFLDQCSFDYRVQQLYQTLSGNTLIDANPALGKVIYELMDFKHIQHKGVDRYADYREKERKRQEKRIGEIRREAREHYENYKTGNVKENASHRRFVGTFKLLLGPTSDLCEGLKLVADGTHDPDMLEWLEELLRVTYVKDEAVICEENIDAAKIEKAMDDQWEVAGRSMRLVKKTSDLMSSLRMNLYKKVYKVVAVLCNYVYARNTSIANEGDPSLFAYKKLCTPLKKRIQEAVDALAVVEKTELEKKAGCLVLVQTLRELESRLSGDYRDEEHKYFYMNFLKNDKVLLNEEYLPILDEVAELPSFSVASRIRMHCAEPEKELRERLDSIFAGDDDYGSAALILKYLEQQGNGFTDEEISRYDITKAVEYPLKDLENKWNGFIEDIELAQSYGQIDNTVENSKETMLQIANSWYKWAQETQNCGFFVKILEQFCEKMKNDAQDRAVELEKNLNGYLKENSTWEEDELICKAIEQIRERIKQQNYAAAEDLLNRVSTYDFDLGNRLQQEDQLEKFFEEYDVNYKKTARPGVTLQALLMNVPKLNKDTEGGKRLIDNWPKNGDRSGSNRNKSAIQALLSDLGFHVLSVEQAPMISDKIVNYNITLRTPKNGRKSNYRHPIAAFGSEAEEKGFRVACIFGKMDADSLIDVSKEIGNTKNTLVLLDFALTLSDRRLLAYKTKTELTGKIFAVIDRVVIYYLARHYAETAINRMLMEVIMPFAFYQPYIGKSADVIPPEMFIGRKLELEKIESPTGVNIVYGGRQLGKTALLRMARKDIDHDENGDRAVLIDVEGKNYEEAARKISETLCDEDILKEDQITEDWNELARHLKNRLMDKKDPIPYLLLLIDEADAFIESCEHIRYEPFDALKEVQGIGNGKFKFVVAGLRNIVRFKREVALGNNSGLAHLSSMTVKPFKVMEAKELLEIPLSYLGFRFPKDDDTEVLISTIFGTTNYFPGLLQLYCMKLIEAMRRDYAGYDMNDTPPYIVKKDQIKRVLAEQSLQQDIRDKFFITLKVGDDDYYYIIALLVAFHYHENKLQNGCSVQELADLASMYSIRKIAELSNEQISALMEEMRELNVLQRAGDGGYRFTRHSFCQMMGTVEQIEDELMNYMEDEE